MWENFTSLVILTLLEIILGVDNILFISIVIQNVKNKTTVRYIGLSLALIIRLVMLVYIRWIMEFDTNILEIPIKNLVLMFGGVFLVFKSGKEVYYDLFCNKKDFTVKQSNNYYYAVFQVVLVDLVFSLDSVLTAIALTKNITIIAIAFLIAMVVMVLLSGYSVRLINEFSELKILALMFIVAIGALLIAEGCNIYIPRSYLYFAFTFSLIVEILNIIMAKKAR